MMGRYGFEYAPQFYRPEGHDKRSRKPEPDVMVYAKPTEHGWQIVYVSIWDTYNDGVYNISVYWDLSDETAEQIYWYELDNIHPYDKKNNIKQLAAGGGKPRLLFIRLMEILLCWHKPIQNRKRCRNIFGLFGQEAGGSGTDLYLCGRRPLF
ncbi:hypothetical protein [Kingella potus]|uniref:hypothetical protein n=1 Tax=Kingella potus TaxID=265175 RepID=UPI001FD23147|nr:hypothetical protein [Kingella potus]UOP01504.1 hypothetical protein LVJ84_04750 [Kingella potus]UOP01513.1 hypothetical protein LVJ84_04795 [Kingella potus]